MTMHDLIKFAIKKLSTSTSPALDAEVLLSHVLDKPKEYLLTNPHKKIDPKLEKKFLILLNRRRLGWPVAYLTGKKEFNKLKFYVDKNVLIPRPETEGLVELVVNGIKRYFQNVRSSKTEVSTKGLKILDTGTGSGNIIISLAKILAISPPFKGETKRGSLSSKAYLFFASDISPKAIAVAKKNAKLHKVKIKFAEGNLLEPWGGQHFDIIIANLPYLAKLVDPSTKYEPIEALVAAKKGLKLYEELFKQVSSLHAHPSTLFLEIGHDQGLPIKTLAAKLLPAFGTKIYKDLFGRTRYARLDSTNKTFKV